MTLRSTSTSDQQHRKRSETGGTNDDVEESEPLDDTLGTRTIYVIVQENLFHGSSGKLSSVFDLKGVLRYGAEPTGTDNINNSGPKEDVSTLNSSFSGSSAPGIWSSSPSTGRGSHSHRISATLQGVENVTGGVPGTTDDSTAVVTGDRIAQLGPANPQVLLDGDFLKCTAGLPVPLFERDKALMNVAIFNDTMFLQMLNVIDYSLLVGVQEPQLAEGSDDSGQTVVVNTMTAGIIDYLHPYNVAKRMEGYFKNAQHELKLRAAESTIQKASEYKRRFRVSADLYFMALPGSDLIR